MEITLNGKQAFAIMGIVVAEAVVAFAALHKLGKETMRANDAEVRSWLRGCELAWKDWQIKDLNKEIAKLKGKS